MKISFNNKSFLKDNEPYFLKSGEIHYFRINYKDWRLHLEKAKEAGLNTVSTYIPWDWHEEKKGEFDFSGETHPQKNLIEWINLCQEYGLMLIVKPGPFILAEYRGAGLPSWFTKEYGQECGVKNSSGEIAYDECMTFLHPTYLEYVFKWYNAIIPILVNNQSEFGGPISIAQVCNEIGVFSWLAHQSDYSPHALKHYYPFLEDKYKSINALNDVYGSNYQSFEDVLPPSDKESSYGNLQDWAKDIDWHDFWRHYYGDYLRLLVKTLRDHGLTVPLYHNLPGWIYGSGWEFPVNITMYEDLYKSVDPDKKIIFGVDHIPEYLSYRNAHDDRIINDITLAVQNFSSPLFAAEFQAGSREYHVVTTPRELSLFYKASLAHGLKGWNYYMFSQGKNQPQKGFSGSSFYWFTPLNSEAEENSLYPVVQETNALIDSLEETILSSERKSEIAIFFYNPYYSTELEKNMDPSTCSIHFQASKHRRKSYFDGLLKAFHLLNIEYTIVDLQKCSPEELNKYKQAWLFSTEILDAESQQKIVDYTTQGGQVVLYPTIPSLDLSMKPCTLIQDTLKISSNEVIYETSPLVDLLDHPDIKCLNPLRVFSEPVDSIANMNNTSLGFKAASGKGSFVVLGFSLSFETEEHKAVYEKLARLSSAKLRHAYASDDRVLLQQRFSKDSSLLFVGNYYNEELVSSITYTHPKTNEELQLPLALESITIPQTYAFLTPIYKEVQKDFFILHTTSDILKIESSSDDIVIRLKGERDLQGEIVFEGSQVREFANVSLNGTPIQLNSLDDRFVCHYDHPHKETLLLKFFN
ncbi:hypothetical protein AB834_06120 [PVC group bacterium (ex Bugula neritina AB1)]|nr:hypothetical protein AB834_06120 [PVC group bacterium (ex Bugula neritina AB1)]